VFCGGTVTHVVGITKRIGNGAFCYLDSLTQQKEITMHYEINVSRLDGRTGRFVHWFATHARSLSNEADAKELAGVLRESLPGNCQINVTRYETVGHSTSI